MTRQPLLLILITSTLAGLNLAACGGEGGSSSPPAPYDASHQDVVLDARSEGDVITDASVDAASDVAADTTTDTTPDAARAAVLDPASITKYVDPLVIPPQMPFVADVGGVVDYRIAVRQFQ